MLAQIPATIPTPPPVVALPAARDLAPCQGKRALQALVVDDEPLVRWAIAETLRAAGYEIQEAPTTPTVRCARWSNAQQSPTSSCWT